MQIPFVIIGLHLRLFVLALLPDQFRGFGLGSGAASQEISSAR
jgi:hypothetical protein